MKFLREIPEYTDVTKSKGARERVKVLNACSLTLFSALSDCFRRVHPVLSKTFLL